jgi:hypothetical protein
VAKIAVIENMAKNTLYKLTDKNSKTDAFRIMEVILFSYPFTDFLYKCWFDFVTLELLENISKKLTFFEHYLIRH